MSHTLFHSALAAIALTAVASAQTGAPQQTNLGPVSGFVSTGHVLTPAPAVGQGSAASRSLYWPSEGIDPMFGVSAQTGAPQQTNLGPVTGFDFTGHVLTPPTAIGQSRAASRAHYWPSEGVDPMFGVSAQTGAPQQTNLGPVTGFVSTGHVLTPPPTTGQKSASTRVLYAPSEADDPVLRAAIAAQIGGGTVDYFDARVANPGAAVLATYDAVFTWANFGYFDNIGFGDELATFVDNGGTVVLGSFCTYTSGNSLAGAIMGAGYSPVVSPTGSNHFSSSDYVGDGTSCIYSGVTTLTATFRDILVTQGGGVADGTYLDGEIAHAYTPVAFPGAGSVVYSNGGAGSQLSPAGDWPIALGNAVLCLSGPPPSVRVLYSPSEADDPVLRAAIAAQIGGGTVDYFDARVANPGAAVLATYDAVFTWANFGYFDNIGFGDELATFVDNGGTVVLGSFCTYTSGNSLAGAIMGAGYSPVVSPLGGNHFASSSYVGDGTSCIYAGVTTLTATYRDILATQGGGVADGTYLDGEIVHAYTPVAFPGAGSVVYSNGAGGSQLAPAGDWPIALGNAVTCIASPPPSMRVLYCPSEADDPVLRAAIAAQVGGGTVDYFDARVANPGGALLSTYDAVFTWANFAYFDNVGFGDELATFVDNGGTVVLGSFCTYTSGNSLAGAIMGVGYSPVVSPLGSNHFSSSDYVGDGISCIYSGVSTLTATYRDILVTQGLGIADGTFLDGEIVHAYSPLGLPGAGSVVYSNGAGGSVLSPSGDWAIAIGNAMLCLPGGATTGSCTARFGVLGTNPPGYDCVTVPVAGFVWQATIDTTPSVGTSTFGTILAVGLGGAIDNTLLFGYELLCLPPYTLDTAFGTHILPVPPGTSGVGVPTQGVRLEMDISGNVIIILMNAQDLIIG